MLKGRCLATGKSRQYTLDGIEAVELLPDRFSS